MANTIKFGNGQWATKKDSILAYNDENANFKPLPFVTSRASTATRVNKAGLLETVASGIPRVDYLGNTKGAYLLEPQRTNNLVQSNQFNTSWSVPNGITLNGNQLSPLSGGLDAWKLESDGSSGFLAINQIASVTGTNTFSIYAKAGTNRYVSLRGLSGLDVRAQFDLINGEVYGSSNAVSTKINHIKDGWYRCTVTFDASNSFFYIYPMIQGVADAGSIYIQYSQLEAGRYASSRIPTTSSAVTRLADTANNAGNNQVISSSEGVLYFEGSVSDTLTNSWISLYEKSNITNNQFNLRFVNSTNIIQCVSRAGGLGQDVVLQSTITDKTVVNKIAVKYKLNDWALWVNGVEVDTATSSTAFTPNSLDVLSLNKGNNSQFFYGKTNDLRVYNTALTDAELAALTQV